MHQDTIGTVMITQEEINAKAAEIGQQIFDLLILLWIQT